jgi:hypothetical protein
MTHMGARIRIRLGGRAECRLVTHHGRQVRTRADGDPRKSTLGSPDGATHEGTAGATREGTAGATRGDWRPAHPTERGGGAEGARRGLRMLKWPVMVADNSV